MATKLSIVFACSMLRILAEHAITFAPRYTAILAYTKYAEAITLHYIGHIILRIALEH